MSATIIQNDVTDQLPGPRQLPWPTPADVPQGINTVESYLSTLSTIRVNICRQRDQALANYHEACGAVQALDAAMDHARQAFAGPPEAPDGDPEKEVACPPTTP
ncbi:MAG: hypothetical protein IT442_04920 [Phycisphaeraceae bacterium]|nr:hypothetical protein [Phycisphaeraceae bacterium]